jgi:hypothetical protein
MYVALTYSPVADIYRWSTADGKIFKDDLEQAATPLPEGWEVRLFYGLLFLAAHLRCWW